MKNKSTKELKQERARIHIRLHPEKDADIIEFLNNKHVTDVVKKLLREKMWAEKAGVQFVSSPQIQQQAALSPIFKSTEENIVKKNKLTEFENFEKADDTTENSHVNFFS